MLHRIAILAAVGVLTLMQPAEAIGDGAQCSPGAPGLPGSPQVAAADTQCTDPINPYRHACRPGPALSGMNAPWYCMEVNYNCSRPGAHGAVYGDKYGFY